MRNIGFSGGGFIGQVGTVSDAILFFDCVNYFAPLTRPDHDWSLLVDRLYRRYIALEDTARAQALMDELQPIFGATPSSEIDWGTEKVRTVLDRDLPTLADVFAKYFKFFRLCGDSALLFHRSWGGVKPLRTIISDMPAAMLEDDRPLAEFDALAPDDKPFWLRP